MRETIQLAVDLKGSLTMDCRKAADLVLPIHYNTFEALKTDSGTFTADVAKRGVPVVLDKQGPR